MCLMLVDGADDVIRVAEILQKDFVELTLLLRLQRALLTHTQKYTTLYTIPHTIINNVLHTALHTVLHNFIHTVLHTVVHIVLQFYTQYYTQSNTQKHKVMVNDITLHCGLMVLSLSGLFVPASCRRLTNSEKSL